MKMVTEDHGKRLSMFVDMITLTNRRIDSIDIKLSTVDANDAEIKQKLASQESQIIANDQKLKSDLGVLESQLTAVAQAVRDGNPGAVPNELPEAAAKLRSLEERVDIALKGLESSLTQVRTEHATRIETVIANMQANFSEFRQRADNFESVVTSMQSAFGELRQRIENIEHSGPALPPRQSPAFPGTWQSATAGCGAGPATHQWSQAAPGSASAAAAGGPGQSGDNFPVFNASATAATTFHHVGGDRKALFEDKVAISSTEWVETTRNYLVSKAFEMHAYL